MAKRKPRKPVDESLAQMPPLDPNVMPNISESKGHRLTDYRPEYDKMLIAHMSKGFSFKTFAAVVEVNLATMYEWAKVHASFHEAKEIAFVKCELFWETLGVYYIVEGRQVKIKNDDGTTTTTKGTEKLNPSLYRLNMVNRFKWTNSGSEESDGSSVTVNLHAQIMEAIKEKRAKHKK